jgi:predicted ArsR family transcriptional regulator
MAAMRVLRGLVASGPATLAELATALGGHANTTRFQLDQLVEDGFVGEVHRPVSGRGRPARTYEASVAGRQIALEDPDRDEDSALVEAVAEYLATSPDPAAASLAIGRNWGRRLAQSSGNDLVTVLAFQGFTPEETPDGIALRTCPLLASAPIRPEVVCGMHQGLIDAVSSEVWDLEPFAVPGACLVHRRPDHIATAPPGRSPQTVG